MNFYHQMLDRIKGLEERIEALEKTAADQNAEALRRYWAKYPQEERPDWIKKCYCEIGAGGEPCVSREYCDKQRLRAAGQAVIHAWDERDDAMPLNRAMDSLGKALEEENK